MNPNHSLNLQPHEEDPRFEAYIQLLRREGRITYIILPNGGSYMCPARVYVVGRTFTDEQKGLIRLIHAGYNFDGCEPAQIHAAAIQAAQQLNMREALRLVRIQRTGRDDSRRPKSDLTDGEKETLVGLVHYDTHGPDYMQLPNGKSVDLHPHDGSTIRELQRNGLSRLYVAGYNFNWQATTVDDVQTAGAGNTMAEAIRLTEQQFRRMRRLTSTMSASAAAAASVERESPKRSRDMEDEEEVGDEEEEESKSHCSNDDDRSVHGLDGAPSTHRKKKQKPSHETDKRLADEEEKKIELALKGSEYITVRHGKISAQLPRTRVTLVYSILLRNVLGVSEEELEKRGNQRDTVVVPHVEGLTPDDFLLFFCNGVATKDSDASTVKALVRQLTLAGAMGVDWKIKLLTEQISDRLHELSSEDVLEIGLRFCNESWLRHAALNLCTKDIKTKLPPHTVMRLAPFWREEAGNPMCTRVMQLTQEQRFRILRHAWRKLHMPEEVRYDAFFYASLSADDSTAKALYKEVNSTQNQKIFADWMRRVGTTYVDDNTRVHAHVRLSREFFQFAEEWNRNFTPIL